MKKILIFILMILIVSSSSKVLAKDVYTLSMLPRYAPEETYNRLVALAGFLSKKIGIIVEPVVERNFSEYEKHIKSKNITIGYQNPVIYVRVSDAHEVLAMALNKKGDDKFRGIIIVREDSDIVSVDDLKNKKISIASYAAAGAYLSQKLALMRKGIDVEKECKLSEAVNSKHENVLFSVFTGEVDAGFIRESSLHIADQYIPPSKIRVLAYSSWLPNWALSVKRSLPEKDKKAILEAVTSLKKNDPVSKTLKISGFRIATDEEYNPVRQAAEMEIPEKNK